MATNDKLTPISDASGMPVDPNVRVPDSVTRAAQAAEEIHKQAYTPDPDPAAAQAEADAAAKAEADRAAAAAQVQTPNDQGVAPATPPDQFPAPKPGDESVTAEEWRHRFLSMQGRYNAAARTIGSMEQQMSDLGKELVQTQTMLASLQQGSQPNPKTGQPHGNLITEEDVATYGTDLIDLARRAARETVTPELEALRAANAELTSQVRNTGKREMFISLDRAVPNWRQINVMPQFKDQWLRLRNVYTGQVRGEMLKAAVDGADAPKVIALFKDFLSEAAATGQMAPAPQTEQQGQVPAPRTPAVALETLAAPGKARPASGDTQVPSDKPIYSRAQISKFYDDSRKGVYAGRQAEYDAIQSDLTLAQREGRIR